jgi:hypothetical protein
MCMRAVLQKTRMRGSEDAQQALMRRAGIWIEDSLQRPVQGALALCLPEEKYTQM